MDLFKIIRKTPFIKIIINSLIGLLLAFYLVPKSPHFKTLLTQYATVFFEKNFDCAAKFTIEKINIFNGTCTLKELWVTPPSRLKQNWRWECKKLVIKIDQFDLFTKLKLKTKLRAEHLQIHTDYCQQSQNLAIAPHLHNLLFAPSSILIEFSNLDILNGLLKIIDHQHQISFMLNWHSQTKLIKDILKTNIYLKKSNLDHQGHSYLKQLSGQIQINSSIINTEKMNAFGDIHFALVGIDNQDQYFLKFKYENKKIICKLNSLTDALDLTTEFNYATGFNQKWQMNVSGILPNLTGSNLINLQAKVDHKMHLDGCFWVENWGKIDFKRKNSLWTGKLSLQKKGLVLPIFWQVEEKIGTMQAQCEIELIKPWLSENLQSLFTCKGKLAINSNWHDQELRCSLKLIDGNLIFPKIYTAIYDFNSTFNFNFKNKLLKLNHTTISLQQGKIEIPCATFQWSKNYYPDYIYFPTILTNCILNFDKQLIGILHGRVLYQRNLNLVDHLTGFVSLDQSLCRYNLLSSDFIDLFNETDATSTPFVLNPHLNLNFFTLSPLKIQSESLETNVTAQLQVVKDLMTPQLIGKINIVGGKIKFPYKPLYINHGNIHFAAEQPNQPIINLSAKNRIKLHNINMQINGLLKNPQINLESFPELTNEQIGALLLVGSENSTLNSSMPTIIMQNLNQAIFGLNYVKFIPSFNEEPGHPGITGAVEIDLDDRLHASIKKNFSSQDDPKFEVDYAVTDNLSIRGTKDERGDLGGEIEIRLRI